MTDARPLKVRQKTVRELTTHATSTVWNFRLTIVAENAEFVC